MNDFDVYVWYS